MDNSKILTAYLTGGEAFKDSLVQALKIMWQNDSEKLELKKVYEEQCNRDFDTMFEQMPQFVEYLCTIVSEAFIDLAKLTFMESSNDIIN